MTRTREAAPASRHRLAVASRIVAATAGGYAVSALAAIALGTVLPATPIAATPITATIAATLAGLLLMPVAAMAVFRARTAVRAWAGTLAAALVCAAVALAGGWRP